MVADTFGYIELADPDALPRDVLVHSFELRRRGDELVANMKLMGEEPASSPLSILKTTSQEKRRAEKRLLLKGSKSIIADTPIVADASGDMEIPLFHFASDVEAFLENPLVVKSTDVNIKNTPARVSDVRLKFNLISRIPGLTFSPTSALFGSFFVGPVGDKDHRVALHGYLGEAVILNIKGRGKVKIEPGFEMVSILKGTITPEFTPSGTKVDFIAPETVTFAEVPTMPESSSSEVPRTTSSSGTSSSSEIPRTSSSSETPSSTPSSSGTSSSSEVPQSSSSSGTSSSSTPSSSGTSSTPETPAPSPASAPQAPLTREQKEQKVREIVQASNYDERYRDQLIKIILLPDINPGDKGKKLKDNGVELPISRRIMLGIAVDRCLFNNPTCELLNRYVGNLRETFKVESDTLGGRNGFPSILDEFLRVAPQPSASETPAPAPSATSTTPSTTPGPTPTPETPSTTTPENPVAQAVESVASALPSVESITSALPSVESITNAVPALQSVLPPPSPEVDSPSTTLEREIKEKVQGVTYSFEPQPCETIIGKIDDNFVKNIEQIIQLFINNKIPGLFDETFQRKVFQDPKFSIPLSEIQTANKGQEYRLSMPTKHKDFRTGDGTNIVETQCSNGEMGIQISINKDHSDADGQVIEKLRGGAIAKEGFLFELTYGKNVPKSNEGRVQTIKTSTPQQTAGECEKVTGKVGSDLKEKVFQSMIDFVEKTIHALNESSKSNLKENRNLVRYLDQVQRESDGKEYNLLLPTAQGPTLTLSTGSHETIIRKVPENCPKGDVLRVIIETTGRPARTNYFEFGFQV